MLLKAIGIGPGDEVITQAFNFVATVEAILEVGAIPVIVNVTDGLNMDPELLEKITSATKAIVPVHMLGVPCDMEPIMAIAQGIPVVEDNCESIGAKYDNHFAGTIGDIGVMSFDHGKAITCGEGGAILTNDSDLDRVAREYHDHGHVNDPTLPRGRDRKIKPVLITE